MDDIDQMTQQEIFLEIAERHQWMPASRGGWFYKGQYGWHPPKWTTNLNDAGRLWDDMQTKTKCTMTLKRFGTYERVNDMPAYMVKWEFGILAYDNPSFESHVYAETAPMAICKAWLKWQRSLDD